MKNESGIHPVEYKCLVKLMPQQKMTAGGLHLPDETIDRNYYGEERGWFIARGGNAFTDPKWSSDDIPKPGNMVIFDKYQGSLQKGKDGEMYRILNDKEIGAIVEEADDNS